MNALAGRVICIRAHSRYTQRFAGANFTAGGRELFASWSREADDSVLVKTKRERKYLDVTPFFDDYARPIVASNRRWIVPSTGKPRLRSKARIARRVPLPMTPSMGPE